MDAGRVRMFQLQTFVTTQLGTPSASQVVIYKSNRLWQSRSGKIGRALLFHNVYVFRYQKEQCTVRKGMITQVEKVTRELTWWTYLMEPLHKQG
jgi:hypothetical protein